jgi:hypothetical protein
MGLVFDKGSLSLLGETRSPKLSIIPPFDSSFGSFVGSLLPNNPLNMPFPSDDPVTDSSADPGDDPLEIVAYARIPVVKAIIPYMARGYPPTGIFTIMDMGDCVLYRHIFCYRSDAITEYV